MTHRYGLYIHVPFCGSICSYCHFARTAGNDLAARLGYVAGVLAELDLRLECCEVLGSDRSQLDTAYIGGGTPSLLEPKLMVQLAEGTVGRLRASPDIELTAEANPESFDEAAAQAWQSVGINRISLGVQSLNEDVLKLLGRSCDPATARRALQLATRTFCRVSADWIIGPGLQEKQLLDELTEAADLGVSHFSLYILEVHPGTRLKENLATGKVTLPRDEHTEALYLSAGAHLENLGILQYEVANFARPGQESRHNQGYWNGRPWLGLGPSAHGYWGRRRYANLIARQDWLNRITAGQLPEDEVDPLDTTARRLERAVLALRTKAGLPLEWIPSGALDLERGRREGWWELRKGRLVLTRLGFLRIDSLEEAIATRF